MIWKITMIVIFASSKLELIETFAKIVAKRQIDDCFWIFSFSDFFSWVACRVCWNFDDTWSKFLSWTWRVRFVDAIDHSLLWLLFLKSFAFFYFLFCEVLLTLLALRPKNEIYWNETRCSCAIIRTFVRDSRMFIEQIVFSLNLEFDKYMTQWFANFLRMSIYVFDLR